MQSNINSNNFIEVVDNLNLTGSQKIKLAHHLLSQCVQDEFVNSTQTPPKDRSEEYAEVVPKVKKLGPRTHTKLINSIKGFYKTKDLGISNRSVEEIINKMQSDKIITINAKGVVVWN